MAGGFRKIFMILKFQWWFLNFFVFKNHFWNHKNIGHVMPAGAFGAVRPVGAILPTATAAGPSHSRSHGRLRRSEGPCWPVMFRWWIFQCLATPIWHWPAQINGKWYHGKLRCLSTDRTALARQINTQLLSRLRRRDKALRFSTLLTTAIRRYVLIIRRLASYKSAKR